MNKLIPRRTFTAGALALVGAPWAARAQAPGRIYRVAIWHLARPVTEMTEDGALIFRAFFQELRRFGFVEGRNLTVSRYSGEGHTERYPSIAREIVETHPDLILALNAIPVRLINELTRDIAIVIPSVGDPVAFGLVTNIARPGANVTGFSIDGGPEINGLRLQFLKESAPGAKRLGYLTTAGNANANEAITGTLREAALRLGVELVTNAMDGIFDEANYRAAISMLASQKVGGILVSTAAEHAANFGMIAPIIGGAGLPSVAAFREYVDAGGLMAYGPSLADNYRKSALYVARILNGEKPGDLPFQQPTVFEFIVNLKTAQTLGITLPESITIRATEVLE